VPSFLFVSKKYLDRAAKPGRLRLPRGLHARDKTSGHKENQTQMPGLRQWVPHGVRAAGGRISRPLNEIFREATDLAYYFQLAKERNNGNDRRRKEALSQPATTSGLATTPRFSP